jgi:AcrR family transcriptional regulator
MLRMNTVAPSEPAIHDGDSDLFAVRPSSVGRSQKMPIRQEAKSDPSSPRERIMAAGLRLFAQKGLHGAGVREIAREAAVNVNLISYYFKTKEELYSQLIEATAHELNSARSAILEDLDHKYSPGVPPVGDIMYAFVHPVFSLIGRDAQLWNDFILAFRREMGTEIWRDVNTRTLAPVMRRFVTVLHRSLPSAKRSDVVFVLELAVHSLTITADTVENAVLGESLRADRAPEELERQLVQALSAAAARFS